MEIIIKYIFQVLLELKVFCIKCVIYYLSCYVMKIKFRRCSYVVIFLFIVNIILLIKILFESNIVEEGKLNERDKIINIFLVACKHPEKAENFV